VGSEIAKILILRKFPATSLALYSSGRKPEREVELCGRKHPVLAFNLDLMRCSSSPARRPIVFLAAGGEFARRHARALVAAGHVVIDNSSAFRMDPDVPLVVPEVNPGALAHHGGLIANPNCSTIQMVVVLAPLHKRWRLRKVVVSTYQSVSGAGLEATGELAEQSAALLQGLETAPRALPHRIAFNLIPRIDKFGADGWTGEELKVMNETRKILGDASIEVVATAVRVPVFRCHSESVYAEFDGDTDVDEARRLLAGSPGVVVADDPAGDVYPMPADCAGREGTFVGRLRCDPGSRRAMAMWIVSDNVWKGAALNAVQIAEELL
jgi:aspartate-semialdehyde dehydrogenase